MENAKPNLLFVIDNSGSMNYYKTSILNKAFSNISSSIDNKAIDASFIMFNRRVRHYKVLELASKLRDQQIIRSYSRN